MRFATPTVIDLCEPVPVSRLYAGFDAQRSAFDMQVISGIGSQSVLNAKWRHWQSDQFFFRFIRPIRVSTSGYLPIETVVLVNM